MAKLNYVEGDYKEALNTYARVGVDDLQLAAVPPYRLRMIAEAYSTKGKIALSRIIMLEIVLKSESTFCPKWKKLLAYI